MSRDEDSVPEEKVSDHIVAWPGKWPKGAKARAKARARAVACSAVKRNAY